MRTVQATGEYESVDETVRRAFESAWSRDAPRPIEEFLTSVGEDRRTSTLEELVHIELEFAWKRHANGTDDSSEASPGPLVENYLARFDELRDPPRLLRLLQQEHHLRCYYGDRPDVRDYCRRFPSLMPTLEEASTLLGPGVAVEPPPPLAPGLSVGRYLLVERQGKGGFGEVWRAYDPELGRDVALKRLHAPLAAHGDYIARFAAEARIAAQLEHPGVVPVYEFDVADDGAPFYTMRLFGGQTLAQAIRRLHDVSTTPGERSLGRARLLSVFLNAARALEFAHDRKIIHRDLKPQNVLIGDYGETIVVDWGLAKAPRVDEPAAPSAVDGDEIATGPKALSVRDETAPGTVMGTPAYMAPEQADGEAGDVDERSDLYALGVILEEILTGRPPRVDSSAPRSSDARLTPALAAICTKATAPERDDRYRSVAELRADVERFLAHEPVAAYTEPWRARIVRRAKRHQRLVTTVAVAAGVGLVVLASMLVAVLDVNRRLAAASFAAVQGQRRADAQRHRAESALEAARVSLDRNLVLQAYGELANNNPARAREVLDACRPQYRDWEWRLARRLCPQEEVATLVGHRSAVRRIVYAPDGRTLAGVGLDGRLVVWHADTGVERWRQELAGAGRGVAFSPDGRVVATACSKAKRSPIELWDAETGAPLRGWGRDEGDLYDLDYSPDGRLLATAGRDETVRIRDTQTGEVVRTLTGHRGVVSAVAFSPDGARLASGGVDRAVILWEVATGKRLRSDQNHQKLVNRLAFSPDGNWLASASGDRAVRLRDLTGKASVKLLERHSREVESVAYSPDGQWLATAGLDRGVRLWDAAEGREVAIPLGHVSHVYDAAFSPDGTALATACGDWTVRVWRLADFRPGRTLPGTMIALHPDNRRLATSRHLQPGAKITFWDLDSGRPLRVFEPHPVATFSLAFSPDGRRLASAFGDGTIGLWGPEDGRRLALLERHPSAVYHVAFSPDGRALASGGVDGSLKIWDLKTGRPRDLPGHADLVSGLAFSPDGARLASSSKDKTAKVWDVATGEEVLSLEDHVHWLTDVAYSHDGRHIATTSLGGELTVWDASSGRSRFAARTGVVDLNTVAFSPDDRRIATGSEELLCLWDSETGAKICTFTGYECILDLAFSQDGRTLVLAGRHREVRVFSGESDHRRSRNSAGN